MKFLEDNLHLVLELAELPDGIEYVLALKTVINHMDPIKDFYVWGLKRRPSNEITWVKIPKSFIEKCKQHYVANRFGGMFKHGDSANQLKPEATTMRKRMDAGEPIVRFIFYMSNHSAKSAIIN